MVPLDSLSPYTIRTIPLRQEKGWQRRKKKRSGGKVHSMMGNWCRDFVARCPSCHQPVLKTSTEPHPFFNHDQTLKRRAISHSLFRLFSDISNSTVPNPNPRIYCSSQIIIIIKIANLHRTKVRTTPVSHTSISVDIGGNGQYSYMQGHLAVLADETGLLLSDGQPPFITAAHLEDVLACQLSSLLYMYVYNPLLTTGAVTLSVGTGSWGKVMLPMQCRNHLTEWTAKALQRQKSVRLSVCHTLVLYQNGWTLSCFLQHTIAHSF